MTAPSCVQPKTALGKTNRPATPSAPFHSTWHWTRRNAPALLKPAPGSPAIAMSPIAMPPIAMTVIRRNHDGTLSWIDVPVPPLPVTPRQQTVRTAPQDQPSI